MFSNRSKSKMFVIASLAYDLATAKSYGFPIRVKLGGCKENFKVTLLERPPEKSYSTSKRRARTAVSVKKFSILVRKFQSCSLASRSVCQSFSHLVNESVCLSVSKSVRLSVCASVIQSLSQAVIKSLTHSLTQSLSQTNKQTSKRSKRVSSKQSKASK